jgi:hypothetical protein
MKEIHDQEKGSPPKDVLLAIYFFEQEAGKFFYVIRYMR